MIGRANRRARFRTVIALIFEGREVVFEGVLNGSISFQPAGANGFGYDPVFIAEGNSQTLAQITMEEKNQISHRALAVKKLITYLTVLKK